MDQSRSALSIYQAVASSHGVCCATVASVPLALSALGEARTVAMVCAFELGEFDADALVAAVRASSRHRALPIAVVSSSGSVLDRFGTRRPDRLIRRDANLVASITSFFAELGLDGRERSGLNGARVLLAEDTGVNRLLMSRILHAAGAEVRAVENGRLALGALADESFDLVLTDIEMPEMDGFELVAAIRAMGRKEPVIALSGHDSLSSRPEAAEFLACIEKGRTPAEVLEEIAALLTKV